MKPITIILVLLIGLATGFLDSIVGSGGLISIPSLIILGLPPQVAIATDRLGTLGQYFGAIPKFWKEKKIIWKYVLPFTIISLIGAYIGANALLTIDGSTLTTLVGVVILLSLPLLFMKKDLGIKRIRITKPKIMAGYFLYFLITILSGSLGAGVGIISFYVLMIFFGFTIIESNATGKIPGLFLSILSLIIFEINGIINYTLGIVLLVGMFVGGYIGARVAIKKGNEWVKVLFAIVVIISGIKLLFF